MLLLLAISILFACSTEKPKTGFTLSGTIKGAKDGMLVELTSRTKSGEVRDTAIVNNEKFVIKGDYTNPTRCYLSTGTSAVLYVENKEMTLSAEMEGEYALKNIKVTGSKSHDEYEVYTELTKEVQTKYYKMYFEMMDPKTSEERKKKLEKDIEEVNKKKEALDKQFIKENPAASHSAYLLVVKLQGKSAVEIEEIIKSQDPVIQKNPGIAELLAKASQKKGMEKSLDEFMAGVKDISYKVDEQFKGQNLKGITYLGMLSDNSVCALIKDGTVQLVNAKGKEVKSFTAKLNGPATSLAVDADDNIYVLCGVEEEVTKKSRGRVYKRMMPKAVECSVFDKDGNQKAHFKLEGVKTATGAKIADNYLVLADYTGSKLAMFDKTNGKAGPVIDNMRPCCGILDFSVNDKKEILVANLGAFRVQGFDFNGKQLVAFGQRGKSLNDFHGCCNPVSVTNLSSGAIVTVEKDPTRIKVYSKEGAKQIEGIEELVKGCSYIPMTVDADDNIYLASGEKGLVKCIAKI
jgi:hypothetical protein